MYFKEDIDEFTSKRRTFQFGRKGGRFAMFRCFKVDLHPLSVNATRHEGNDLLPNQKHEAKEDFSPVGPIVREIIWLK